MTDWARFYAHRLAALIRKLASTCAGCDIDYDTCRRAGCDSDYNIYRIAGCDSDYNIHWIAGCDSVIPRNLKHVF